MRLAWLLLSTGAFISAATLPPPPKTPIRNVTEQLPGVSITDPYRRLEDQNSPETRAWIDPQIESTKSLLNPLPDRDTLHRRVEDLAKTESMTSPIQRGARYFHAPFPDQNQALLYLRTGFNGHDELLIDPNPLSPNRMTSVHVPESERRVPTGQPEFLLLEKHTRRSPSISALDGTDHQKDKLIFGDRFGPTDLLVANVSHSGNDLLLPIYHGSAAIKTEIYFPGSSGQRSHHTVG